MAIQKKGYPEGLIPEREAKLLEGRFVHGMTLAESAKFAGYEGSVKSIVPQACRTIQRHLDTNGEFIRSLQKVGIDPSSVSSKIKEGLEAKMYVKRKVDKDTEELVEVPDNHARHKFVETVIDVMGAKAPKKVEIEQKTFEQRLLEITMRREG